MPLTEVEADKLELLRLKRRRLELQQETQIAPEITAQPLTAQEAGARLGPQDEVVEEPFDFPVGAAIGGTIGAAVSASTGPGAIGGAALGAAAGEAGEQLVRRAIGAPAPETSEEAARAIAIEGALGAAGEFGGRLAIGAGGRVINRFSKNLTPEAADAIDFLNTNTPTEQRGKLNPLRYVFGADKQKLALLPAEATDDRVLDILQNVSEASLIGGSAISDFKLNRLKFIQNLTDDVVDSFGAVGATDELGALIGATIDGRLTARRLISRGMYNEVDDLTRGLTKSVTTLDGFGNAFQTKVPIVSTKSLKEFAAPILAVKEQAGGIADAESGANLLRQIMSLDDNVDYTVMKNIRSAMRTTADTFSATNKKAPAIGVAKKSGSIADEAIDSALSEHSPEALKLWRESNELYKNDSKELNTTFLRKLVNSVDEEAKNQPEKILPALFQRNNVSRIREVSKALGGKGTKEWQKVQAWNTADLFAKATNKKTGELTGASLKEAMFGRTGIGKKAMESIYSEQQLKTLSRLSNALEVLQKRQAEGAGRMFIQLSQAGALVSLPFQGASGFNKTAATILLGPAVLARVFTNPALANIFIEGIEAGTKSKVAAGAMGRFLTDVANMQLADQEPRQEVEAVQ